MKKSAILCLCFACITAASTSRAIDLKQSKVTQVVNDVQIISAADQAPKPAVVDEIFSMPINGSVKSPPANEVLSQLLDSGLPTFSLRFFGMDVESVEEDVVIDPRAKISVLIEPEDVSE